MATAELNSGQGCRTSRACPRTRTQACRWVDHHGWWLEAENRGWGHAGMKAEIPPREWKGQGSLLRGERSVPLGAFEWGSVRKCPLRTAPVHEGPPRERGLSPRDSQIPRTPGVFCTSTPPPPPGRTSVLTLGTVCGWHLAPALPGQAEPQTAPAPAPTPALQTARWSSEAPRRGQDHDLGVSQTCV